MNHALVVRVVACGARGPEFIPNSLIGLGKTENLLIYNCSVSATLIDRTSVDQYWSKVCGVIF